MSDSTTIARPYAKAIFSLAFETKTLSEWSQTLHLLAQTVLDPNAQHFITNPSATVDLQIELLLTLCAKSEKIIDKKILQNVLGLLAHHKRLLVLPDIFAQFETLRAESEKTLVANVSSFASLTTTEQTKLMKSLSHRLQRHVTLDVNIDESLLGGAVIRAGDLVIDGSVRGQLNKLMSNLAA
ncbi:MAG: F0F1 ATP synthase subunit delta [Legionellales bacterium]|nr:F0F1 ATP synthase subunit delta [Legionellales bacterium]